MRKEIYQLTQEDVKLREETQAMALKAGDPTALQPLATAFNAMAAMSHSGAASLATGE
jgi:hypothetical protein